MLERALAFALVVALLLGAGAWLKEGGGPPEDACPAEGCAEPVESRGAPVPAPACVGPCPPGRDAREWEDDERDEDDEREEKEEKREKRDKGGKGKRKGDRARDD